MIEHDNGEFRAKVEAMADAAEPVEVECPTQPVEPFKPFPVDALPGSVRRLVEDGAQAIGCDSSFFALPALGALAASIGNTVRVRLKGSWSEPSIIWAAVVAPSGAIKSPPMRAVMRPIYDAQSAAFAEYEEANGEYEVEKIGHDRAVKAWKGKKKCVGDPPIAPRPPIFKRYVTADATVQALAPMLADNPRGVLVACPELSSLIAGFGQFTGARMADAAAYLSLWDADTLIVDRKTGNPKTGGPRTIIVRRASASIVGTVQPGVLERVFGADLREAGALARFVFAAPPSRPVLWRDDDVSDRVRADWASIVHALAAIPLGLDEHGAPVPRMIDLDEEARAVFIEWHDAHAGETADAEGDLAAALAKIKGYAARFALVLHLAGIAAGEPLGDRISRPTMLAAIRLAEWFKGEARRVYGRFGESDEDRDRRRLVEWIRARRGSVTVRDLTRGPRRFRDDPVPTEAAKAALDDLAAAGFGRWEHLSPGPKGGRSTVYFRLRDSGDGDETPHGDSVSGGNVAVATAANPGTNAAPDRRRVRI